MWNWSFASGFNHHRKMGQFSFETGLCNAILIDHFFKIKFFFIKFLTKIFSFVRGKFRFQPWGDPTPDTHSLKRFCAADFLLFDIHLSAGLVGERVQL